jgi:hypothetical protein
VVKVEYRDVLPYRGPRTARQFRYLLDHSSEEPKCILGLHQIAKKVQDSTCTEPHIFVEIIESLDTKLALHKMLSFTFPLSVLSANYS